jgi:hypothetical protein
VNGEPLRLAHDGRTYRVTDTPTRFEDEMLGMTHPLPDRRSREPTHSG